MLAAALAALLLLPLSIEGFELAESKLGPPRDEARAFAPGERVHVRFLVSGFTPVTATAGGPDGFELGIGVALRPVGTSPTAAAEVPIVAIERAPNAFGAKEIPIAFSFPVGGAATSGAHDLVVVAEDRPSGRRAEHRRRLEFRPLEGVAYLGAWFAADGSGERERAPAFVVGEEILLVFAVGGLRSSAGKVRIRSDLTVLEADRVIARSPGFLSLETPVRPGVAALDGAAALSATRAGTFRLRVETFDLAAGTSAVIERSVEVREAPRK